AARHDDRLRGGRAGRGGGAVRRGDGEAEGRAGVEAGDAVRVPGRAADRDAARAERVAAAPREGEGERAGARPRPGRAGQRLPDLDGAGDRGERGVDGRRGRGDDDRRGRVRGRGTAGVRRDRDAADLRADVGG